MTEPNVKIVSHGEPFGTQISTKDGHPIMGATMAKIVIDRREPVVTAEIKIACCDVEVSVRARFFVNHPRTGEQLFITGFVAENGAIVPIEEKP